MRCMFKTSEYFGCLMSLPMTKTKKLIENAQNIKLAEKLDHFLSRFHKWLYMFFFFSMIMIYTKTKGKKTKVDTALPQQYSVLLGKNKILKYEYQ